MYIILGHVVKLNTHGNIYRDYRTEFEMLSRNCYIYKASIVHILNFIAFE